MFRGQHGGDRAVGDHLALAERDDAVASRGAALVMRNAANAPPAYRPDGKRLLHFLPALIVVVLAIVAALLLHLI